MDDETNAQLVIDDEELPKTKKPPTVKVDLAGTTYTLHFPKIYWWLQWIKENQKNEYLAELSLMDVTQVSLSEAELSHVISRLKRQSDPLDAPDLFGAAAEALTIWGPYLEPMLRDFGSKLPDSIEKASKKVKTRKRS